LADSLRPAGGSQMAVSGQNDDGRPARRGRPRGRGRQPPALSRWWNTGPRGWAPIPRDGPAGPTRA
jgi:hypothetical protein